MNISRGIALLVLGLAYFAGLGAARTEEPAGRWRDVSMDDYRAHLEELSKLTAACAKARDLKSCDPVLVGKDDRVALDSAPGAGRSAGEHRVIRYEWLRVLFARAEQTDAAIDATGNFVTQGPGERAPRKSRALHRNCLGMRRRGLATTWRRPPKNRKPFRSTRGNRR